MNKPVAFVMGRVTGREVGDEWIIRVVIPSLDKGGAVWLETVVERKTFEEANEFGKQIVEQLRNVTWINEH